MKTLSFVSYWQVFKDIKHNSVVSFFCHARHIIGTHLVIGASEASPL